MSVDVDSSGNRTAWPKCKKGGRGTKCARGHKKCKRIDQLAPGETENLMDTEKVETQNKDGGLVGDISKLIIDVSTFVSFGECYLRLYTWADPPLRFNSIAQEQVKTPCPLCCIFCMIFKIVLDNIQHRLHTMYFCQPQWCVCVWGVCSRPKEIGSELSVPGSNLVGGKVCLKELCFNCGVVFLDLRMVADSFYF